MGTAYLPSPMYRIAYYFFSLIVPTSGFMFFLDVNPEEAYRRIVRTRKKLEMFESVEELERTRRKALNLASIGKWSVINANKSEGEVEKELRKHLIHYKVSF